MNIFRNSKLINSRNHVNSMMKVLCAILLSQCLLPSTSVEAFQTSTRARSHQPNIRIGQWGEQMGHRKQTLSTYQTLQILNSHQKQKRQQHNPQSQRKWSRTNLQLMKDSSSASSSSTTTAAATADSNRDMMYSTALRNTFICMGATVIFGLGVLYTSGYDTSEQFFAGYLVEQSLSIDNLFVFLLLFDYFQVPIENQNKVLSYGIYGAVVMRAIMIGLGALALENFREILLVFAGILVYSSVSVLAEVIFSSEEDGEDKKEDMDQNAIVNFSKNLLDTTDKFDGDKFFSIQDGVKKATPLFLCLVAVEISDVVFAVDSIPAVFGITTDPVIVFTSNMFAILGLRSLYTILSKAAQDLEYLEPAVAVVLGFIGSKMIAQYCGYCVSTPVSLAVVATCLSAGVGLSVWTQRDQEAADMES